MSDFELTAEVRDDMGKGASRRLRRLSDSIPAILYGGDKPPQPLSLIRKDLEHALENEAFYSHILTLHVGSAKEKAILKDLQRHPAKDRVMHADFLRVSDDVAIKINVPVHFINEEEAPGVTQENGVVQHAITEIEIMCLPGDMPEYIEVDLAGMNIGDNIHLTDLKLPKGVEATALTHGEEQDLMVASIMPPVKEEPEEPVEGEVAADEVPAGDEAPAGDGEGDSDSDEDKED
ncbi:MAG: 50S ribosomal protein L25/general stress protein Ctc [Halieaceae bacterium]|jgi:large subunit ribosomal protein L25|nr:50S ribosomal protein L25/general stress protein Ctc [Halieaceae bacterium]